MLPLPDLGRLLLLGASALVLAACGGAGGPGPAPVSSAPTAVAPTPTPTPTPAPAPSFDTAEYRRSSAAVQASALAAWQAGASGQGVTIGFIDSGIDSDSPEFAGRLSAASRDVSGLGRTVDDASGHGTAVAGVAAAARNDSGMMGIAWNATIAAFRADNGNCTDGCRYTDGAIAAGLDAAVAADARVVNISLGGSSAGAQLRAAFARATQRGTVLVISAGNDGEAQPDPLALGALQAASPGHVLVVGSIGPDGQISSFSNRAGTAQQSYLVTLGEDVRSFDETGRAFLYSGTSFSTPAVSGAVALLAQAFPNLTGARIAEILLLSADDLGDPGVDAVYGRGRLNIGRAMAPIGQTSLSGTAIPVTADASGTIGSAMGSGLSQGSALQSVPVTDGFARAYVYDLARTLRVAGAGRLAGRLQAGAIETASTAAAAGPFALALTLRADPARAAAPGDALLGQAPGESHLGLAQRGVDARAGGRNPLREALVTVRHGAFGLGFASGELAGEALPGGAAGGLVAPDGLAADDGLGIAGRQLAMADWQAGPVRLALAAATRTSRTAPRFAPAATSRQDRLTLAAATGLGPVDLAVQASDTTDAGALLGTSLAPHFGLLGGRTRSLGAAVNLGHGPVALRLAASRGWTRPSLAQGALFAEATTLDSRSWSAGLFARLGGGTGSLRVAQPLAVTGGGFRLATGEWLDARATAFETVTELGYDIGPVALSAYARSNAGNLAGLTDRGAAIRLSFGF